MGRPSVKDERQREALDAYLRCVARFGLEGATLERIAEEAGLKRPLIRHHLGNRDEMKAALVMHVAAEFDAVTARLREALPVQSRIDALLGLLFGAQSTEPTIVLAFAALTLDAQNDANTRAEMSGTVARYESFLREELARAFPAAAPDRVAAVAQGVMALSFNLDALSPLAVHETWKVASRHAADLMIAILDNEMAADMLPKTDS